MKTNLFTHNVCLCGLFVFLLFGIATQVRSQTDSSGKNFTKEINVNMQESCYLLLCKTNDNSEKLSSEHYVMGEVILTENNQKTCISDISVYFSQSSGGTHISDNCGSKELVLVQYQGTIYVAMDVTGIQSVSFSGSVSNEALLLVKGKDLTVVTHNSSKSSGEWQSSGSNIMGKLALD